MRYRLPWAGALLVLAAACSSAPARPRPDATPPRPDAAPPGDAIGPAPAPDAGTGGPEASASPDALALPADAAPMPDAASTPDMGATEVDGADSDTPPPLQECAKPSIDRIELWNATGEGTTVPMNGSLLVKTGDHYVAKEQFVGSDWHVLEVLIGNVFEAQADLSQSSGFLLTYSSTSDLWVQMRPASHYDGDMQWGTKIPSTGGQMKQQFFSFAPSAWGQIPGLDKPALSYPATLSQVRGLLFVGPTPNTIALYGLRIDGYAPPCR